MSLCILIGLGGTGKSSTVDKLIHCVVSESEQPMILLLEDDTVVAEETADLAEHEVEMDIRAMLEASLYELCFERAIEQRRKESETELSSLYQKIVAKRNATINSEIKAKIEEYEATVHRVAMCLQECIDEIETEFALDIDFIKSSLMKCVERFFKKPKSAHRRNAKKGAVGYIDHLRSYLYTQEDAMQILCNRRLTEPNQALQYIGLRLRPNPKIRMQTVDKPGYPTADTTRFVLFFNVCPMKKQIASKI